MIKYYESSVVINNSLQQPSANVTVANRTGIAYNDDITLAGIMADVTNEQHQIIIDSGGVEKTQAEIASIYPFPAVFSSPPNFGA